MSWRPAVADVSGGPCHWGGVRCAAYARRLVSLASPDDVRAPLRWCSVHAIVPRDSMRLRRNPSRGTTTRGTQEPFRRS